MIIIKSMSTSNRTQLMSLLFKYVMILHIF